MKWFLTLALGACILTAPLAFIGCCKPDVARDTNDVDALNAASQAELQKKAQAR